MAARVARSLLLLLLAALQLAGGMTTTTVAAPAARPPPPLLLPLLPGVRLELSTGHDSLFLRLVLRADDLANGTSAGEARKKSSSFSLMPLMMLGSMISHGMFPFMFANLNMLVMKAVMMNNMVLGMALFNTVRDVVFGPKPGPKVVYKNYGYRRRPTAHHPPLHVFEEGPSFHGEDGHLDRQGPGGRGSPIPLGSHPRDHQDRWIQRLSASGKVGGIPADPLPQSSFAEEMDSRVPASSPDQELSTDYRATYEKELIKNDDAKYLWEVLQPPGMKTVEVGGPTISSKLPMEDHR